MVSFTEIILRDAIDGFTAGEVFAAAKEKRVGKLLNGYYVDLIVLDEDPFSIPLMRLPVLKTSATMVGGSWAWKGFKYDKSACVNSGNSCPQTG
jgi:predicted amidohydrolase YtcJ